jgi:hypothetical protein
MKSTLRKIQYIGIVHLQPSVMIKTICAQTSSLPMAAPTPQCPIFLLDLLTDPYVDFNLFVDVEEQRGLNTPNPRISLLCTYHQYLLAQITMLSTQCLEKINIRSK